MFIPEIMGYPDYLLEARKLYKGNKPSLDHFYNVGAFSVGKEVVDNAKYRSEIKQLSEVVNNYLSHHKPMPSDLSINFPFPIGVWPVHQIANILVPYLEENLYGCHLFVDKLYIYRNVSCKQRKASWIWHFDNNPKEVFKIMIYLTDVKSADNAPFEYLVGPDGGGIVAMPTRISPDHWNKAKNNSRITDEAIQRYKSKGCKSVLALGPAGTATAFTNDVLHRANIPKTGHRDVLVVRVRPTLEKIKYVDKYSTSFEVAGVVPKNAHQKK